MILIPSRFLFFLIRFNSPQRRWFYHRGFCKIALKNDLKLTSFHISVLDRTRLFSVNRLEVGLS